MLRGLWQLTWLEIKIFMREPLGAIGTIVVPVLTFIVLGRLATSGARPRTATRIYATRPTNSRAAASWPCTVRPIPPPIMRRSRS